MSRKGTANVIAREGRRVTHEEAVELIRDGVPRRPGVWVELGAGTGTFTRALADLLGPGATIVAVDRSRRAVRRLRRLELPGDVDLRVERRDFTDPLELPVLDGALMANALHFADDQADVLARVCDRLVPGGRLLLVEYDRDRGNRWVPNPVPPERFRELAAEVALGEPREVGRRPSAYHGRIYAAVAKKPPAAGG